MSGPSDPHDSAPHTHGEGTPPDVEGAFSKTHDPTREIRLLEGRGGSERDPEGRSFAPLADAYRRAGRLEDAVRLVEEGTARLPDFASGHVVAGLVHRDSGNAAAAREAFQRVLELDPANRLALEGLAEAAAEPAMVPDADVLLEDPEPGVNPASPEPSTDLPFVDSGMADLQEADSGSLDTGLDLDVTPRSGEDHPGDVDPGPMGGAPPGEGRPLTRTMGDLYAAQGHLDEALAVYEQLSKEDPEDLEIAQRLEELRARVQGTGAPAPPPDATESPEEEAATDVLDASQWVKDAAEDVAEADPSPFAWADEEPRGPSFDVAGIPQGTQSSKAEPDRSARQYFQDLLAWAPGAVPIESLRPDADPDALPLEGSVPSTEVPSAESPKEDRSPGSTTGDLDEFDFGFDRLGP